MFNAPKLLEILSTKKLVFDQNEVSINQYLREQILPLFENIEFGKALFDRAKRLGTPVWDGDFGQSFKVPDFDQEYSVLAVDGSQILPDRHFFGTDIALIQIGGAYFSYGKSSSSVEFLSDLKPIFSSDFAHKFKIDRSFVEQMRDLLELESAISWAKKFDSKPIIFMDGSLSFLLERFGNKLKITNPDFSARFFGSLEEAGKMGLTIVFYTSCSSGKTFINLIKMLLCRAPYFDQEFCVGACGQESCSRLSSCNDSALFSVILPTQSTSQVFAIKNTEFAVKSFFINTDHACQRWFGEIAKLEILGFGLQPFNLISLIFDQICKGFGYPIGLCQAHETAVLDTFDRQAFKIMLEGQGMAKTEASAKLESKNKARF